MTTLPLITEAVSSPDTDASRKVGCGQLLTPAGERLPLKALAVETRIVGLTATSSVRQRFLNAGDVNIEATYVFPLPPRAGVTEFAATLGGRRVLGVLKERGQARTDYEQALAAGQRAAIVEEDRSDVFTMRVGNLGPGEEATVELLLVGPLEVEDGEATFRFPLVVASRYTAGTPVIGDQTGSGVALDTDKVGDASRVTPPRLASGDARPELDVTVIVDGAGLTVSDIRTSLHSAVIDGGPGEGGPVVVSLQPGEPADRDFLLRFGLDRSALSTSAVIVPDPDDPEQGTWSVTVVPPAATSSAPRDVIVVLDRSGSMDGWKMVAARRAAGRIVDSLVSADRFCLMAFDDVIETPKNLPDGLVPATDRNRFAALSWLGSLDARGGTEMTEPLVRAADMLRSAEKPHQAAMVLVTDGQISGEDHVLRNLQSRRARTTFHCVGVDRAVNAGFLDRLARLGKGSSHLVESEDRLDEVMRSLAQTIGRPALTGIEVTLQGREIVPGSVTPTGPVDAFSGVPCVITGRYRVDAARAADEVGAALVTADSAGRPFRGRVEFKESDVRAIRTIWARSRIRDLEDAYASRTREDEVLPAQIVEHSMRFGVLSRFTAFVAIDAERTDAAAPVEVIQPVEQPAGWAQPPGMSHVPVPIGAFGGGEAITDAAPHPSPPRPPVPTRTGPAFAPALESVSRTLGRIDRRRAAGTVLPASQPTIPARDVEDGDTVPAPGSARDLEDLLRTLEQALRDESVTALVELRIELLRARDTSTGALRTALEQLCTSVEAYVSAAARSAHPDAQAVRQAVKSVRAAANSGSKADRAPVRSRLRFWE